MARRRQGDIVKEGFARRLQRFQGGSKVMKTSSDKTAWVGTYGPAHVKAKLGANGSAASVMAGAPSRLFG